MNDPLERVFNPRSVAVIGASEVPGKAAERRTRSLIEGGYAGRIHLVNPKRERLFGRRAYRAVRDIQEEIDLAMIVVPPRFVLEAVSDSVSLGAKAVIIITAGLGESGEAGKRIEAALLDLAFKSGTYVIGPNCSGMYSAQARLNLLGIPGIRKGGISVLAQSGNVIDSLTHYAARRGMGFGRIISLGNAIGASFPRYLEYLREDPETQVIAMYLEGIREGQALVRAARETVTRKPVIALKVGRSGAGARAAASHTGSLAGDDVIVDAALRQAGIIRVCNVDELFDMAQVLSACPLPAGGRLAILSEGGGDNSIAADNAEIHGLTVPVLSPQTQERIKPFLLAGMPASNPIDYGGTAEENPHVIAQCVEACMASGEVDAVLVTGFFGGFKDIIAPHVAALEEQTARELAGLVERYRKPLVVHTSFAREPIRALELLEKARIPVFDSSERAAACLSALVRFAGNRERFRKLEGLSPEIPRASAADETIDRALKEGRRHLLETECRSILTHYGIAVPEAVLASEREEAAAAGRELGFPLAMKVVSPDIVHKSEVGGVALNLQDEEALRAAYDGIMESARRHAREDRIAGVLLAPMAAPGQECILGMVRDPQFGPVLMFGLGGIFVEVLRDVAFRVTPPAQEDVRDMIREIRGYPVLAGVRGKPPKDVAALEEILVRLSAVAQSHPEIQEIDLNPVIVHETGASIVDARMILGIRDETRKEG